MPERSGPAFLLDVATDSGAGFVRLRLTDEEGRQLAAHQVVLAEHSPALWQGLFDTRDYIDTYAGSLLFTEKPATADDLLAQIGVFLGEKVLGPDLLAVLHAGIHHRSLVVRQPTAPETSLAAAFARVPWEIARPALGEPPLLERNLVVRMETPASKPAHHRADAATAADIAPPPGPGEALRVLLVFAEAPGSRPLAMRLEREQLLELFYENVMPKRRVSVEVLCHGVTQKRLQDTVRESKGFHVVHWSGHGHHNLLELAGEDGLPDLLSGADLVDLFRKAGGFIPQLVFLSACLSGTLTKVRDWATLEAALRPGEGKASSPRKIGAKPPGIEEVVDKQPGYTGTGLALLGAGVPQVVAMRYAVGDAYARDLAGLFYRRLLADGEPKAPASALSLARGELLERRAPEHDPVDHATPLLFGREAGPLPAPAGRSTALRFRRPQPQPLLSDSHELDPPAELVGRGEPLRQLRDCLEQGRPAVALVQGLAGLGKTALVAEAIHLWHRRFDYVFAFQSKPLPLGLEDFFRRLDEKFALHSQPYREICDQNSNARVYLPVGGLLQGEARWRQMRDNLLEAFRNERVLLVFDNFETQLEWVAGADGYTCADREWDHLLGHLTKNLPGSGSRLLVTSRHPLAALALSTEVLWLPLGPLPMAEAMLFLEGNEALHRLTYSDEEGWRLALRLLNVSRGHPLILTRLGALAGDRSALSVALDELAAKGLGRLPDVFAAHLSEKQRKEELAYLEDVAVGAVDLLIGRASAPARQLLWVVTLAAEPVFAEMMEAVWSGAESVAPLLAELRMAGLLTLEPGTTYGFHELVRERAAAWMEGHPEEKGGRTEDEVWVAYGKLYAATFKAIQTTMGEGSQERAVESGRRGISYFVRARAFDRLSFFASGVVISMRDPRLLSQVISELAELVEQVPAGKARWSLRTNLADALRLSGRPEASLRFYGQALAEAEGAKQWADVGWICQNWGNALVNVGRLDDAKATYLQSAEAKVRTGSPRLDALASEMEALRIDVMQGKATQALPEVESRLHEIRAWWQRRGAGEVVLEAPDSVFLARVLVGGLNIAAEASLALKKWEVGLGILTELEETERAMGEGMHSLAMTRFNWHGPLLRLGRFVEAEEVLESCLAAFRGVGDLPSEATTISALADLWDERGERKQAIGLGRQALAVRNRLSNLEDRAVSHSNLASYLHRLGIVEEDAQHRLAAISYALVVRHYRLLEHNLRNLAIDMREAAASGGSYELPRLAELLACPEFEPLRRTLTEWKVAVEELQAEIDQRVEEVRRRVAEAGEAGE